MSQVTGACFNNNIVHLWNWIAYLSSIEFVTTYCCRMFLPLIAVQPVDLLSMPSNASYRIVFELSICVEFEDDFARLICGHIVHLVLNVRQ